VHLKSKGAIAILSVLFLFSGFLLVRCARPGTPAGGPKDTEPPKVVSEAPPNKTVYFNSKKAEITFNEFIQLKDASKEIFISPPMRTKPEFKVLGKKVIVEFQEELKENSTYTINFGNAIVDFTEGNPLVNFEYVFSTGGHIDSLYIPGLVLDAFDHKPVEDVIVMVYQDNNDTIALDSLPLKVPPASASKTTKEGIFRINNLAAGVYKIFALEDLNNNYIFDMPNERIAFLDSLITLTPSEFISVPADSTDTADIEAPAFQPVIEDTYTLYLFEEHDPTQKLLGKKLIGTHLLQYIFRLPADSVKITPVGFATGIPDWVIMEYGVMRDTVNFWLKPGLPDTIRVCVSAGDSLVDTARFILTGTLSDRPARRKETVTRGMSVFSNAGTGALDLNKKLRLFFALPVQDFDPDKFTLWTPTDTLSPVFSFSDSLQRQGEIEYKWLAGEFYQVIIEDSAFCDLSGSYNDSTFIRFKVRNFEDYGILLMDIILPDSRGQSVIQLMTDKEVVLRQNIITTSGLVKFEYLMPGNYKLKAIFDVNSNGKWDTGNYRKNSLPERVEYYTPALSIRANWDLKEEWKLE
jgi:uncharacterized protein (DUF2141 family)